jgi:DNA-binding MarR family transcriptional regulator
MSEPSILDLIYKAHRYLSQLETSPHDYSTGDILFSSDIHTVKAVSEHEGCNLTELADSMGVSIPAAFKFARKMLKLGYLTKRQASGNAKEVCFSLTQKGKNAVQAHELFEQKRFAPLRVLEEGLSAKDRKVIIEFLERLSDACSL